MEALINILKKSRPENRIYTADSMELEHIMSKSEDFHFGNFKGIFEETWPKGKKVECTYCPCSQKYLALGSWLWALGSGV